MGYVEVVLYASTSLIRVLIPTVWDMYLSAGAVEYGTVPVERELPTIQVGDVVDGYVRREDPILVHCDFAWIDGDLSCPSL